MTLIKSVLSFILIIAITSIGIEVYNYYRSLEVDLYIVNLSQYPSLNISLDGRDLISEVPQFVEGNSETARFARISLGDHQLEARIPSGEIVQKDSMSVTSSEESFLFAPGRTPRTRVIVEDVEYVKDGVKPNGVTKPRSFPWNVTLFKTSERIHYWFNPAPSFIEIYGTWRHITEKTLTVITDTSKEEADQLFKKLMNRPTVAEMATIVVEGLSHGDPRMLPLAMQLHDNPHSFPDEFHIDKAKIEDLLSDRWGLEFENDDFLVNTDLWRKVLDKETMQKVGVSDEDREEVERLVSEKVLLGDLGIDKFIAILQNEGDLESKMKAFTFLENKAGDDTDKIVQVLINILQDETDASIRGLAIRSLATICNKHRLTFSEDLRNKLRTEMEALAQGRSKWETDAEEYRAHTTGEAQRIFDQLDPDLLVELRKDEELRNRLRDLAKKESELNSLSREQIDLLGEGYIKVLQEAKDISVRTSALGRLSILCDKFSVDIRDKLRAETDAIIRGQSKWQMDPNDSRSITMQMDAKLVFDHIKP